MAAGSALARPHETVARPAGLAFFRFQPGPWDLLALATLTLAFGAYLVVGWSTSGDQADMANGKAWMRWLTRNGVQDAYRIAMDYPPVPLYLFALAGSVYERLVDPSFNERSAVASQTLTLLWKLPGIVFQLAIAGLIYVLVRPRGERVAFLAMAGYALNPAVAYDVPHLGQTDPLPAAFSVATFGALTVGYPGLA